MSLYIPKVLPVTPETKKKKMALPHQDSVSSYATSTKDPQATSN